MFIIKALPAAMRTQFFWHVVERKIVVWFAALDCAAIMSGMAVQ